MPYVNQVTWCGMWVTEPKLEYWTQNGQQRPTAVAMLMICQRRKAANRKRWKIVKRQTVRVRAFDGLAERWVTHQKRKDWALVIGELRIDRKKHKLTGESMAYPWIAAQTVQFLIPRIMKSKNGYAMVKTDELRELKLHKKMHQSEESPWSVEEMGEFEAQVDQELDLMHDTLTEAEESNMLHFEEWDDLRHPLQQPDKLEEPPEVEFDLSSIDTDEGF